MITVQNKKVDINTRIKDAMREVGLPQSDEESQSDFDGKMWLTKVSEIFTKLGGERNSPISFCELTKKVNEIEKKMILGDANFFLHYLGFPI